MRKLLTAGLAVAALTGIAYGQVTGVSDADQKAFNERIRERFQNPPTCVDADGVTRNLDENTTIGPFQFKCVETYGKRLTSNGANWIQITPADGRFRYLGSN
jgi:hypothetical protein